MNIWSDNPELLEELSTPHIPVAGVRYGQIDYKGLMERGEISFYDVPDGLRFPAMDRGTEDFISGKIDEAIHYAELDTMEEPWK